MLKRRLRLGLMLLWIIACQPAFAHAQTGRTAQIPLQFDFLNPGARSLALGSTFVAIADDATSAFTNPAGLTLIVRKEASAELRHRELDTTYLAGGRLSGTVTNQGVDTITGPSYSTSADSALRLYFLSFVYPVGRWSIAGYRHELVRQSNPFLSQGEFQQSIISSSLVVNDTRQLGLTGDRTITIDNYGGAVGYRLSNLVSLGLGVAIYRFDVHSDFGSLTFVGGQFGPADLATKGMNSTTTQSGQDTQAGVNVGTLITVTKKVRLGAVYRQGVTFQFEQVNAVPGSPTITKTGRFRTPAVAGVGVRLQPTQEWSFAFDFDRVQYSRLRDDYIAFQVNPADLSTIDVPSGNELHFAAEYTLVALPHTPSLRLGSWYDPTHSVRYATNFSSSANDIRLRAYFPPGESLWHFTIGGGLPLSKDYEVNVGADFTKGRHYVSASIVARFGK